MVVFISMAIIVFTERHGKQETLDFINGCSTFRNNIIFCLEDAPEDGARDNIVTPTYLAKWSTVSHYYGHLCLLLKEFQTITKNPIYNVDTVFPDKKRKDLALTFVKDFFENGRILEDALMFYRDQCMAENLIQLQQQYPGKDIVLIVGALHGGILYHLLAKSAKDVYFINSFTPSLTEPTAYYLRQHFFDALSLPYPGIQYEKGSDCIALAKALPPFEHVPIHITYFQAFYNELNVNFKSLYEELAGLLKSDANRRGLEHWCKRYTEARTKFMSTHPIALHLHTQPCYTMQKRVYGAFSSLAMPATLLASYFIYNYLNSAAHKARNSEQ